MGDTVGGTVGCGRGIDSSDPVAIGVDVMTQLAEVRVRGVGLEIAVGVLTNDAGATGVITLAVLLVGASRLFVPDGCTD